MITSIVFDLGGVLYDIDPLRSQRALAALGVQFSDAQWRGDVSTSLVHQFECGELSVEAFIAALLAEARPGVTMQTMREAACALLVGFQAERIAYLQRLRGQVKLYLLSNTNALHIEQVERELREQFGVAGLSALFDATFLSYELGLRKPNGAIFHAVSHAIQEDPARCLFVDDLANNTAAAAEAGFQVLHKPVEHELCEVLPLHLASVQ